MKNKDVQSSVVLMLYDTSLGILYSYHIHSEYSLTCNNYNVAFLYNVM